MGFSALWKLRARLALKNHWQTALLIMLIVNLGPLLLQGIGAVTGNDLTARFVALVYGSVDATGTMVDQQRLMTGIEEIWADAGIWTMQGATFAVWLLTPFLTLGMVAWLLDRLRRREDTRGVLAVFSHARLFLKTIGMRLYILWRVFLFSLPGFAVMLLSWVPLLLSDSNPVFSMQTVALLSMSLMTQGMAGAVVLFVISSLRYSLANMVLADHPEMGPVAAAKESRRLTKGKKGKLFALCISFFIWKLLAGMISGLFQSMFGDIPALMVEMLLNLAISVYLTAAVCAFYLDCRGERPVDMAMEKMIFQGEGRVEDSESPDDPEDPDRLE